VSEAVKPTSSQLGCYVVPGGVRDPRAALEQARTAEELGLGAVWIGERFDTKDLPSLAGAVSQVTSRVAIGAAVTMPGVRHPMVVASLGQTLQSLTGGRFRLGFGRSAAWRWEAYGLPSPSLASLRDLADILRRLWNGETVSYRGPAGDFPRLYLPQRPDVEPPPLLLAAVGPKTLALAGSHFDGAILHPFLTPDAVKRSVERVRGAAESVGRDPGAVRVYAAVVTASDTTADDADRAIRSRGAGYFHVAGLGDALVHANGWDEAELARYRAHPTFRDLGGQQADKALSRETLIEVSRALPDKWIESASAAGDAATVASQLREFLNAGADEIVLHGSTADRYRSLASSFR
jgi:probable F420-dependent oxidoreductase